MSIFSNCSSKIFVNYIFHFFGIMNRTMLHLSISIYKIWISPDFLNFTHILFCWILYLISLISFWFFWSLFNCLWTRFQLSISIFNIVIFPVFLNIAHILFYFILDFLSDLFYQFLILLNSFYLLVFFCIWYLSSYFLLSTLSILSLLPDYMSPVNISSSFSAIYFIYLIIIISLISFIIIFFNTTLVTHYPQSKNFITVN